MIQRFFPPRPNGFIVQMVSLISWTRWKKGEHLVRGQLPVPAPLRRLCPQCLKAPRHIVKHQVLMSVNCNLYSFVFLVLSL